jgi:predicted O-methyltransferase YrrM
MRSLQILVNYFIHRIGSFTGKADNAFIIDFRNNILKKKVIHSEFGLIEKYRSELSKNPQLLKPIDLGAGTKVRQKNKTIGSMSKKASVSRGYGQLLYRLSCYYKPDNIIELGTALGISTMYLAIGNPMAKVITVEGNPQLAEIASKSFAAKKLNNITLINSTFDDSLARLSLETSTNTLVFIDGNHTFKATMKYFEVFGKTVDSANIIVFDDINWSEQMMQAWKSITESVHSGVLVDLFHMGILFQGRGMNGEKFRLRY